MSPITDLVGLALHDGRIEGVVVRRRFGVTRVRGGFTLDADDGAGRALQARLRELGAGVRHVHVGIPRRRAVVKTVELPGVAGADLRRMIGFELERHLPFPPSEAVFDFDVLEARPGQPVRILLAAVERRAYDRIRQLLREAGLVPRVVDLSIHAVARLAGARGQATPAGGRVVVKLDDGEAEVAVVVGGRVLASRAVALPADPAERGRALGAELERTLAGLAAADRERLVEVAVTGGEVPPMEWRDLPVRAGLTPPVESPTGADVSLAALAVALERSVRGVFPTNLIPEELRPRPFPWPVALTAGLALLALLLAGARPAVTMLRDRQSLTRLDQSLAQLAPEVRRVEQLALAVERARREAETLRSFDTQSVRALPALRELTELLPSDVWLTSFSADRNGIELAGLAGSASQLIPLIEASPRLERVEFTSPVTKGRDREQFRLKAAWERPAVSR